MTRSLSPFWPFEIWFAWWEAWGAAPYVALLRDSGQARALARLHATAFARPWDAHEFERMLCERSTEAHALWQSGAIQGFVLSRRAADEAEILTVVLAPPRAAGGLAHRLLARPSRAPGPVRRRGRVHLEVDEGNARRSSSTPGTASGRSASGRATTPAPTAAARRR